MEATASAVFPKFRSRIFPKWMGQYSEFCLIGGIGMLVDMGVLAVLTSHGTRGWPLVFSKLAAAEIAMVNNFVWNETWTFRAHVRRSSWMSRPLRFVKFNLICSGGVALATILLWLEVHELGVNLYVGNFLAIAAVSLWNFGLNYRLNWVPGHEGSGPGPDEVGNRARDDPARN